MTNSNKDKILSCVLDYLKLKVAGFKIDKKGNTTIFSCPLESHNGIPTAIIIPKTYKVRCFKCNKIFGDVVDLVRILQPSRIADTEEEILLYVRDLLKLNITLDIEIDEVLDFFEANNFDLLPIIRNQKIPIEKAWTSISHKNKSEWKQWLNDGLNIGVRTGKTSNLTVLDIDQQDIPQEISDSIIPTLYQSTSKGHHLFFKYTDKLPTTRIDKYKLDILNDGKQAVIYPSIVDGVKRKIQLNEIAEIPKELVDFLLKDISVPVKPFSEKLKDDIKNDNIDILQNMNTIVEGNRNNFLLHYGGILRKELNPTQTGYVLHLANRLFCKPQLSLREIDTIVNSLEKYATFDESELALKILQYMKIVEEANSIDIREALGEKTAEGKQRIEKAIGYLVKEGFLVKKKRNYHIINKAIWKEQWFTDGQILPYKIPYFDDIAIFRRGDMIILGAPTGFGKTHISQNFIKRFVEQGVKPNYISSEPGGRFMTIASTLQMKEGDFRYIVNFKPANIELEDNAVTIIDWLLPEDYASTDKLYQTFAEQLEKHGGLLIVFTQLKDDGSFFAKNMINFFSSLSAKFLYEDETRIKSYFQIEKIRERKGGYIDKIPLQYFADTKLLKRIDEINE